MRVLVTGASGLLGWWLVRVFAGRGHEVYAGLHRSRPPLPEGVEPVHLELLDAQSVVRAVAEVHPDAVIHAAAYTDVDGCEGDPGLAYRVNYLGTLAVARASARIGAFLVYVSTDYVFDGTRGLYREDDVPRPINYYGLSKLLGEAAVAAALGEGSYAVVRVSGLYGYSPTGKRNFAIVALERLTRGEEVRAFVDQWLSPTYVRAAAESMEAIVSRRLWGTWHVAGERLSRYEFAVLLAEELGVDRGLVKPVPMSSVRLRAPRPRDSSLDTSRAKAAGIALPPIRECIRGFIADYRVLRGLGG